MHSQDFRGGAPHVHVHGLSKEYGIAYECMKQEVRNKLHLKFSIIYYYNKLCSASCEIYYNLLRVCWDSNADLICMHWNAGCGFFK